MAEVVAIERVIMPISSAPWHVRKMKATLEKQGQIEPLQVQRSAGFFVPFSQDVHACEIIAAARELGWATLLVVVMDRYEG